MSSAKHSIITPASSPTQGHESVQRQSPAPRLGFIGWGRESAVLWRLLGLGGSGNESLGNQGDQQIPAPWLLNDPQGAEASSLTGGGLHDSYGQSGQGGQGGPGEPNWMNSPDAPPPSPPPPPNAKHTGSVESLFAHADIIFIEGGAKALAPHLPTIRLAISDQHMLALLGAGWSLADLNDPLKERKLLRLALPGAPQEGDISQGGARDGIGVNTAFYCPSPHLPLSDQKTFLAMFAHFNQVLMVPDESAFETMCTLGDLIPGAYATMVEALADAMVTLGLPRKKALPFLLSVLGAASESLLRGVTTPEKLREQALGNPMAASGLVELEAAGLRAAFIKALRKTNRHISRDNDSPNPIPTQD